jgi:hypothetical protein
MDVSRALVRTDVLIVTIVGDCLQTNVRYDGNRRKRHRRGRRAWHTFLHSGRRVIRFIARLFLAPVAAIAAVALSADPARAQNAAADGVERFERSVEQIRRDTQSQVLKDVPAGQRALFDYGGYLTLSYLSFDDSRDDNHAFRGYDLVGYARLNFDNAHDIYLRGRLTYRDYNTGDSFENQADHLEGHIEEAYYRFDLAAYNTAYRNHPASTDNLVVQVGRQFETWSEGLVLSQYIDGGRVVVTRGPLALELLASVTAQDLTVDFDASRPGFQDETRRAFYGAMLSGQFGKHHPFVYAMAQRDQNSDGPVEIGPLSTSFRYNSYYLGVGSTGSLSDRVAYGVEFVYEGGETLSSSFDTANGHPAAQQNDSISAYAGSLRLDYLFPDRRRSRVGGALLFASGDTDRGNSSNTFGGNQPGTTDHAFNALGFVNNGLAFAPTFSNLIALRGTASTYPFASSSTLSHFQVGVDVFAFGKFRRDGAIDEPSTDSRYLGWEPDLFINWQVTDDVTFVLRYGVFFPGSGIPSDDARQFFYAGLTYAF